MATNRQADNRRVVSACLGAKSTHDKGAWAEMIACSWLLDKGFEVYRNISQTGKAHLVAGNGERFIGIRVRLTAVDFRNPLKPTVVRGNVPVDETENLSIIDVWVSHDGVCAFDRSRLQEIYRAAAAQASMIPDPETGRLYS